jgi:hypothetical protein
MTERKTNRSQTGREWRSKWRALAQRKYSRLTFMGGDGGENECWIVLTKCPHQQTRNWRYALRPSKEDAEALLATWHKGRCSYTCQGTTAHSLWRIYE